MYILIKIKIKKLGRAIAPPSPSLPPSLIAEWLRRRKAVSRYSMKQWKYKKQASGHQVTQE